MAPRYEDEANNYADLIIRYVLPTYPVMNAQSVHDAIRRFHTPLGELLCCIGEVMKYYSMFDKGMELYPDEHRATLSIEKARHKEPSHAVIIAELLYAIFGLYSRCTHCIKDGIEWATTTLLQIPDRDRNESYRSTVEIFARIQLDHFSLPPQQLQGYELIKATLNGPISSTLVTDTLQETLWRVERMQEIINFWAPSNMFADIVNLRVLKEKILEVSSNFRTKHFIAILYIRVLSSVEDVDVAQEATSSVFELLHYLQEQTIIDRVRSLSLECHVLAHIATFLQCKRHPPELYGDLQGRLLAAESFLEKLAISHSGEDPVVWAVKVKSFG